MNDSEKTKAQLIEELVELRKTHAASHSDQAHQQDQLKYRQIFEKMSNLFLVLELIYDANGKVTDCAFVQVNSALEALVHMDKEQVIGKRIQSLLGTVEDYWLELLERVDKTGTSECFEDYNAEFDKFFAAQLWKFGKQQVAVVFADITERMKIETALRRSEQNYRMLFECSRDALMTLRPPSKNFTSGNAATLALFGVGKESDFIARGPAEYSPERQPDGELSSVKAQRYIEEVIKNGSKFFEWTHKRSSGEEFPATVLLTRVEAGDNLLLQATVRDESERKQLEAQVAQSERLASMGMLAAGVAHEINNPLSYILYNLESLTSDLPQTAAAMQRFAEALVPILDDKKLTAVIEPHLHLLDAARYDDIGERLQDALEGTNRIKDIVRGLGSFSRVDETRDVPIDLTSVIDAATNLVSNEIRYRARLVKEYGEIAHVMANDGKLSQVFLNLLLNAAHAITEGNVKGNEVRVRTWQEGDEVFAEVSDTGRGIPEEHLSRLFEPFFTTKQKGLGTGLGLSISMSIIDTYGGRLEVKSKVGEGSSFLVRLPAHVAVATESRPSNAPPERVNVSGRVLLVDDEGSIRTAMARMLRGYDVVEADSGNAARDLLETDRAFDLILCDIMMPGMSGAELHEWLSTMHPKLAMQVVFVTGGAFSPKARDYLANVSNIRLGKPFDVARFKNIVAEQIEKYRAQAS